MLVRAGHRFEDLKRYTPDQIEILVEETDRQLGEELLADAQVQAAAASVGMTGNTKPLEALTKAIRKGRKDPGGAVANDLQSRMKGLARSGLVRPKE